MNEKWILSYIVLKKRVLCQKKFYKRNPKDKITETVHLLQFYLVKWTIWWNELAILLQGQR